MQSKNNKAKTATTSSKKVEQQSTSQTANSVVAVENPNTIVEQNLQNQVVEVKKTKTQKNTKTKVAETKVAETKVDETKVDETKVAETVSKGKKGSKALQKQTEVQAVAQQVTQPVAETQPVTETQVAGSKGKKGSKATQKQTEVQVAQAVVEEQPVAETQTAGSKTKKSTKTAKKVEEPVQEAVQEQHQEQDDEEQQVGGKLRYFKLFYNGQIKGRYCGKKPKQAANKAFSSIIKELNAGEAKGVNVDVLFSIKECTRTSKHKKEYNYVGKREALPNPVPVFIPHKNELKDTFKTETSILNIPITQKKVLTLHSGKEVSSENGSIYFITDAGQIFKKITYFFHNKIKKAPKVAEEAQV